MRPTVAIKIPEVDEMIARAQQKVEAIRQAKQKVSELRPNRRGGVCTERTKV